MAGNIRRNRPVALYAQVEERIHAEIERENLKPGARLPTEAELCKRYEVSRSTIRQALNRLEVDGLITRTRGKGTFLRKSTPAIGDGPAAKPLIEVASSTPPHKVLGLVFCARSDTLQMSILLGVERAAKSRGYGIMFGYSGEDVRAEQQEIERLLRIGADGVIIMPVSNETSTPGVRMLQEHNTPAVLVDRYLTDLNTSYVVSDGYGGTYRLTEHLIILGYQSFAFINSGKEWITTSSVGDRFRGYRKALDDYSIPTDQSEPMPVNVNDTDEVRNLLTRDAHGLAVVAVHDAVAISLMRTAASIDLIAPVDYAVVGFDDLPIASHLQVPLTTVLQPRYDLGFKSGHLLMDKIEGREITDEKMVLPVSLMIRESCGAHHIMCEKRKLLNKNPASI